MDRDVNRRDFLRSVVVVAGGLTVGSKLAACGETEFARYEDGAAFFPLSVASGDPKPSSVILWTRAVDSGDVTVHLQVSTEKFFQNIVVDQPNLVAKTSDDNCLKVKVTGLEAGTWYWYRFIYDKGGARYSSPIGRTRTAPSPGSNATVRFAVLSCQDYVGRYYNTLLRLAEFEDLDFVLHLGDYIYETTGDPMFQTTAPNRVVTFTDSAGAISLGSGNQTFQAAKSLSNYRQLYQIYRGDRMLKRVHERFPMIHTWDDHEFTNDSYGDSGVYRSGRTNEADEDRKRNAERAFFEYIPLDDGSVSEGTIEVSDSQLWPNTKIYRDLRFGQNVHLLLTDYRSYRPDHLIPEGAFPGKVVVPRAVLEGLGIYAAFPSEELFGYVDIDASPLAPYKAVLTGVLANAYAAEGLATSDAQTRAAADIQGNVNIIFANGLIQAYNAAVPQNQQLPLLNPAGADRGVAFLHMGKTSFFSSLGSRSLVVKAPFELYAGVLYQATSGASENALGTDQETWLRSTLSASDAKWKLVGSPVSFTQVNVDLSNVPGVPATLAQKFIMTTDHWDGFPNKKKSLLEFFASVPGTVVLSGDLHSAYVNEHALAGGGKVVEFTGPGVSSSPFKEEIAAVVAQDPTLSQTPGIDQLIASVGSFIRSAAGGQQRLTGVEENGFYVVTASADAVRAEYHLINGEEALHDYYDQPEAIKGRFLTVSWTLAGGVLK